MLTILKGDWIEQLRTLPDESVQSCVTSPPYWGLRNYGVAGQLGSEKTPSEYISKIVSGFQEVRRVLKDDGTLWLNLGDSYARNGGTAGGGNRELMHMEGTQCRMTSIPKKSGLKEKDLIGIPWLAAFALRTEGWYLRSDIIWSKPNCMPESVTDRPTRSHEYLFLLSKNKKYYYDSSAIAEPCSESFLNDPRHKTGSTDKNMKNGYAESKAQNPKSVHRLFDKQRGHSRKHDGFNGRWDKMERSEQCSGMRNKRDVWTVAPACYPDAHFATFPPDLIRPCILAGSRGGDTILDPFFGSGTTGQVSLELGRKCIGIELNPDYIELAKTRCNITPGLAL